MLRHQLAPHYDVAIFDFREPRVDVLLACIGLRFGENSVEKRRVAFVTVMLVPGRVRDGPVSCLHETSIMRVQC